MPGLPAIGIGLRVGATLLRDGVPGMLPTLLRVLLVRRVLGMRSMLRMMLRRKLVMQISIWNTRVTWIHPAWGLLHGLLNNGRGVPAIRIPDFSRSQQGLHIPGAIAVIHGCF